MAKNIEPKLKKIGEYLKLDDDYVFSIPEYQRAYSWGINQCDKLWQDIIDYTESGRKDGHFFGTIIVNCKDDDESYELIDGQQRTTSFLLLLKAILLKINEALEHTVEDKDSLSLYRGLRERRKSIMSILYNADVDAISDRPDPVEDSIIYNSQVILKNCSINEKYKTELQNILQGTDYKAIAENAYKIPYKQKENKFTNFFRNFKFFYQKLDELKSDSKVNQIARQFIKDCEIIEIKSWKMGQAINMFNCLNADGLPLYDSDIISSKLYAAASANGEEKTFKDLWAQLDALLKEKELGEILDLNSLLMQYMYYIRAVNKETISESGAINVTTPGLRRYYTDINRTLISKPVDMCTDMLKLAKIWKKVSTFPLTHLLLKFNENSKLFLASYFYRLDEESITEKSVQPIFECMLRLFALLELVDIGFSSKYFKTFLFGEQVHFVNKDISQEDIEKDFQMHIHTYWNSINITELLDAYTGNSLVHLNEYLFAKENGIAFTYGEKYDIEHIMPYSGHNIQEIRKDAEISSEEEFYEVVNKLGNKILLEEKINRSIGNEWFRTKVSTTLKNKPGYKDSTYPIAGSLFVQYENTKKPYWTKDDIQNATNDAINRIVSFIFGKDSI